MRKAIAIDFDGCLCTNVYPEIGEPNWSVIRRAQAERRAGAGLILWTCREDQLLLDAIAACEGWGLTFDAVNESLPDWIEAFGTKPRKVGATEYWDDKAVRLPDIIPADVPLTLEELRGMNDADVWVAYPQNLSGDRLIMHALVEYDTGSENVRFTNNLGGRSTFDEMSEDGGLAYRRKPEEVQHDG